MRLAGGRISRGLHIAPLELLRFPSSTITSSWAISVRGDVTGIVSCLLLQGNHGDAEIVASGLAAMGRPISAEPTGTRARKSRSPS